MKHEVRLSINGVYIVDGPGPENPWLYSSFNHEVIFTKLSQKLDI